MQGETLNKMTYDEFYEGFLMVASHKTVEMIIHVLLKYVDRRTALKIARDFYCHVPGNKSVMDTFSRIVERLEEEEEHGQNRSDA